MFVRTRITGGWSECEGREEVARKGVRNDRCEAVGAAMNIMGIHPICCPPSICRPLGLSPAGVNQSEMRIMALPQPVQTSKYDRHAITPCMSPLAMHRCQTPSGQNAGRRTNWRSKTKSTRCARVPLRGSDREGARSPRASAVCCSRPRRHWAVVVRCSAIHSPITRKCRSKKQELDQPALATQVTHLPLL